MALAAPPPPSAPPSKISLQDKVDVLVMCGWVWLWQQCLFEKTNGTTRYSTERHPGHLCIPSQHTTDALEAAETRFVQANTALTLPRAKSSESFHFSIAQESESKGHLCFEEVPIGRSWNTRHLVTTIVGTAPSHLECSLAHRLKMLELTRSYEKSVDSTIQVLEIKIRFTG